MGFKKILSKRGFLVIYHSVLYLAMYTIVKIFFLNKLSKKIWIISEREDEARDNGYHMFKYIRENYPEIKIFYIIKKNSMDLKKIKNLGNIIDFGSLKHILYYFMAEKQISTHINGFYPNEKAYRIFNKILPIKSKIVFLQHGIIKDYLKGATSNYVDLDLFVCGAAPEFKYISDNYGHDKSVTKYLGLARFDLLHNQQTEKQILLMPTFRMDFYIYPDDEINEEKENYFLNTTYYKRYQSLINNTELNQLLKKYNINLVFYPHYEVHRYIHLFHSKYSNVTIANKNSNDVQKLLKESKLLITDYSSVYFDFAYMEKPIIYYQFDYKEYREVQYKEGYFSYSKDGFGPVIESEHTLIEEIYKLQKNDFLMGNLYKNRKENFFILNDTENRKRNYEAILNLWKRRNYEE